LLVRKKRGVIHRSFWGEELAVVLLGGGEKRKRGVPVSLRGKEKVLYLWKKKLAPRGKGGKEEGKANFEREAHSRLLLSKGRFSQSRNGKLVTMKKGKTRSRSRNLKIFKGVIAGTSSPEKRKVTA